MAGCQVIIGKIDLRHRAAAVARFVLVCILITGKPAYASASGSNPASEFRPDDRIDHIEHRGRKRSYLVHLPPSYRKEESCPLVLVLHGGAGDYRFARKISNMSDTSDREGFIVVYPNGVGRFGRFLLTWNAGDCCGYSKSRNVDDVDFIRVLIDRLIADYSVDTRRIYVTGFSNGAMLAYLLACRLSNRIAAIAPVGGSMSGYEPRPDNPVSVMIFHGTNDRHVPFAGGTGKLAKWGYPVNKMSVMHAVDFWRQADGCLIDSVKWRHGQIAMNRFSGGRQGTEVCLIAVDGGKHAWPGGRRSYLRADSPTPEISATELMWEFFTRHPKQGSGWFGNGRQSFDVAPEKDKESRQIID